jgi:ornithine cyclodeaminase/alanine dehydrogenase-like protein (mu-crystallin family)
MNTTLFLSRSDVERLLAPEVCRAAVEQAFRQLADGAVPAPEILAMHAEHGSFHVKAGLLTADRPYFAAKLNANFPENGRRHGLPTIQGAVLLSDAFNGVPLAIMDSISITALRTAAASAVATKYLARKGWEVLGVCGCGGQAEAQIMAMLAVGKPERIVVYDLDAQKANAFAQSMARKSEATVRASADLTQVAREADVLVTCTTAKKYFVTRQMVRPGTFIAAVGADHENKQEIEPELLAASKVVTDITAQAAAIGDLHHAIVAGAMSADQVHAELGEVVCGRKPGRVSEEEIIVFDSTGTGLQDVAAAIAVYQRARALRAGLPLTLSETEAA